MESEEKIRSDAPSLREPSNVWLVWASSGEYSDRTEWALRAFTDEAAAKAEAERLLPLWHTVLATHRLTWPEHEYTPGEYEALDAAWAAAGLSGCDEYNEPSFYACEIPLIWGEQSQGRLVTTNPPTLAEGEPG